MTKVRRHGGMEYKDFLAQLIKKKGSRNYVEVGVCHGEMFARVEVPSIGIDPFFDFKRIPPGNKKEVHLYQMSSDEYFRDYDPKIIFGRPLDFVFLDGLHLFEFLLRDFINAELHCHANAIISLDDCLPPNTEMTERVNRPELRKQEDVAGWWTGDVCKVVLILRKYRPDLKIVLVDTMPTGNVCVTRLNNESTVLRDNYYEIVEEFMRLELTEEMIAELSFGSEVISAADILSRFDWSRYLGA